jgi:phosphonate transport system substrate-binding protein
VIVAAGSSAESLDDLHGSTWAYNEPDSHSGYLATLFRLYEMGEADGFFDRWVMTGFHQESIRLVATGHVDASAVDSQVLAVGLRDHPELRDSLRIVESIGPSTIQPLVATRAASATLRQEVTEIVTALGADEAGRAGLSHGLVERFVAVDDDCYSDIRTMLAAVEAIPSPLRGG